MPPTTVRAVRLTQVDGSGIVNTRATKLNRAYSSINSCAIEKIIVSSLL